MKSSLQRTFGRIGHNWGLYLLLLPSLILLIIFSYKPMYGVIIAFKDYKNSLGIVGSPWADPLFKHFIRFFNSFQCGTTIKNTLALSLYSMLVGFPIPIILALMINQITAKRFRKGFQTVLYLPHFISTVVMVGLLLIWLSPSRGLLALHSRFQEINVEKDQAAEQSIYRFYQALLNLRRTHDAFLDGSFRVISTADDPFFIYTRSLGSERWIVVCNFDRTQMINVPFECNQPLLSNLGRSNMNGEYQPYECAISQIK